jgi:pSer/pThr/pTyr-binding forkhead associated (FHA) protein
MPVAPTGKLFLHSLAAPPIRLRPDRPTTIGRAQGNDLVLPSEAVSRRHAHIEYRDPSFYFVDQGSANGSYLNNELIKEGPIVPGDEIRIGIFTLQIKEQAETSTGDEEDLGMATVTVDTLALSAGEDTGIAGKLEEMSLPDICQFLAQQRKTGTLLLHLASGEARVYFRDGSVVHAETADLEEKRAFYFIFAQQEGTFQFRAGVPLVRRSIKMPTTTLLLEAARVLDEEER